MPKKSKTNVVLKVKYLILAELFHIESFQDNNSLFVQNILRHEATEKQKKSIDLGKYVKICGLRKFILSGLNKETL